MENQPETTDLCDTTDTAGLQPKNRKWNEKRSKLLAKTTNYITLKDRKSLMTIINLLAKHKNRNFLPKKSDDNVSVLNLKTLSFFLFTQSNFKNLIVKEMLFRAIRKGVFR